MQEAAPFILNDQTMCKAPVRPGRVYVLSSGMMTPKTLSNVIRAADLIENPQHSIFFVGYARPGIACRSPTGRRDQTVRSPLTRQAGPARPLQYREFQFSAHAIARGADRLREETGAAENRSRARRSTGSGVDALDTGSGPSPIGGLVPTPGVELEL